MTTSPFSTSTAPAESPPERVLRVLYADDLPELRSLMTAVLSRDGYQIETVGDGSEALARLKQDGEGFDLLITDHHMPGTNGLELVRQTRALAFPGKIVVFSSELSEEVHEKYRRYGVDAILAKPVYPLSFRAVLDQMFHTVHLDTHPARPAAPLAAHA